eukprot:CAMPEP_0172438702 /NCGR_PEP_ID=MMETSP1064-20121228/72932_1 /TAXON_ID=202472 /ORGANISM="Aulacoseira subarctica , Strain CCAP 1002/5" /LENGTH=316 /DNA_ID=CAMNT_0013187271 /DNA_START=57 /DNA_END=1007 /DNA_ORIENTATION=+
MFSMVPCENFETQAEIIVSSATATDNDLHTSAMMHSFLQTDADSTMKTKIEQCPSNIIAQSRSVINGRSTARGNIDYFRKLREDAIGDHGSKTLNSRERLPRRERKENPSDEASLSKSAAAEELKCAVPRTQEDAVYFRKLRADAREERQIKDPILRPRLSGRKSASQSGSSLQIKGVDQIDPSRANLNVGRLPKDTEVRSHCQLDARLQDSSAYHGDSHHEGIILQTEMGATKRHERENILERVGRIVPSRRSPDVNGVVQSVLLERRQVRLAEKTRKINQTPKNDASTVIKKIENKCSSFLISKIHEDLENIAL